MKVCVLGNTGVGKSKLINQFLYNEYDEQYKPTTSRGEAHHCQTLLNGNLYQLKIIDMPAIKEFPADSIAEWSEFKQCALRNANAYVFVFDLNNPATFYYIKGMNPTMHLLATKLTVIFMAVLRDQLFESRNMQNVPVWIVGNKADTCLNVLATMRSHRHDQHHQHHLIHSVQQPTSSPYEDIMPAFKEFANLVKKQWKCSYTECSAKYNWRVLPIFREILKSLESTIQMQNVDLSSHHHQQTNSGQKEIHLRSSIKVVNASTDRQMSGRGSALLDTHATTDSNNDRGACSIF